MQVFVHSLTRLDESCEQWGNLQAIEIENDFDGQMKRKTLERLWSGKNNHNGNGCQNPPFL